MKNEAVFKGVPFHPGLCGSQTPVSIKAQRRAGFWNSSLQSHKLIVTFVANAHWFLSPSQLLWAKRAVWFLKTLNSSSCFCLLERNADHVIGHKMIWGLVGVSRPITGPVGGAGEHLCRCLGGGWGRTLGGPCFLQTSFLLPLSPYYLWLM